MRSFVLSVAAANRGSVQLSGNTDFRSVSDVRLGQVLADQLRIAPQVESVTAAEEVHALTGTTMFNKPKAVMLALLDGANGPGAALDSDCEPRKECVGQACYGTSAACVLDQLVSQTDGATLSQHFAQVGAVSAVSSDPRLAAAGYGAPHLAAHDTVSKTAVYGLTNGPTPQQMDLTKLVAHVEKLTPHTQGLRVHSGAVTIQLGNKEVTLDLGNVCVRLVLGEALAIEQLQQDPSKDTHLYLVAPRGVACMNAAFGQSSTETMVAKELMERSVAAASQRAGAWTMTVRLPSPQEVPSKEVDDEVVPNLLQSQRRLAAVADSELGSGKVADYHIFLWSTLAIVGALYAAVYAITSMTNNRDPLLYAKFRPEVDPSARR